MFSRAAAPVHTRRGAGAVLAAVLLFGSAAAWALESGLDRQQAEPIAVLELAPGVRLEVLELKRVTGGLLHLTLHVVNDTDEQVDARNWGMPGGGVRLLDLVNLKRHDPGNGSSASHYGPDGLSIYLVAPHGRREYWAQYQAPPDDVTVMTLQIPGMAAPLYDIPIGG